MRHARKLVAGLVLALSIIVAALLLWLGAPTKRLSALPNPNGYDEFVRAGTLMQGNDFSDFPVLELPALRGLLKSNSAALVVGRHGLTLPCYLAINAFLKTNGYPTGDLMAIKRLAQLFAAEGRAAELENRAGDAAHSYIDSTRVGNESSRGGFMIHRLVGVACESIGLSRLVKLMPALDCNDCRWIISDLQKLDIAGVEWRAMVKNERQFMWHQVKQYRNPVLLVQDLWRGRSSEKKAQVKHDFVVAQRRLLITELALRCYKTEQGHPPKYLAELLPKYLDRIPADPFSGNPLLYRPGETNWLLYSVGQDKVDNGGTAADQFLDSRYRFLMPF